MPSTKVSVDRLYQKTGSPTEKKERYIRQLADDIFTDLLSPPLRRKHHAQQQKERLSQHRPGSRLGVVPLVLLLLSVFGTACSEQPMSAKEDQAIRLVKSYAPSEGYFSIISNIDHKARESGQAGNAWSWRTWEAGLQSQTDRLVETLSQYLNVFEAPGGRWVRFAYADSKGIHEAAWEVDIYRKRVVPQNTLARELTTPVDAQRAMLPPHLTGPGTWAGGD